jgi:transposase
MPAAYSQDLRERVVNSYLNEEGSQRKIAERFQVSLSFVKRLIRRHRETGTIKPLPHGGGAKPLIRIAHQTIVKQLVDEQADALLEELCERFQQKSGIKVSVTTMYRAVQRLKLTTKKNTLCK